MLVVEEMVVFRQNRNDAEQRPRLSVSKLVSVCVHACPPALGRAYVCLELRHDTQSLALGRLESGVQGSGFRVEGFHAPPDPFS